ncbi:MAG TPA: condensation domain-containing protein, partial [Herpetosiphonaceae bacterium]
IGMTMSMRIGAEARTTIGPLINHPVFNIEVQPEATFAELCRQVQSRMFSYYKYLDFPFEYFHEHRADSAAPGSLFDFLLNFHERPDDLTRAAAQLQIERLKLKYATRPMMRSITCNVYEQPSGEFICQLRIRKDRFGDAAISTLSARMADLVSTILEAPGTPAMTMVEPVASVESPAARP